MAPRNSTEISQRDDDCSMRSRMSESSVSELSIEDYYQDFCPRALQRSDHSSLCPTANLSFDSLLSSKNLTLQQTQMRESVLRMSQRAAVSPLHSPQSKEKLRSRFDSSLTISSLSISIDDLLPSSVLAVKVPKEVITTIEGNKSCCLNVSSHAVEQVKEKSKKKTKKGRKKDVVDSEVATEKSAEKEKKGKKDKKRSKKSKLKKEKKSIKSSRKETDEASYDDGKSSEGEMIPPTCDNNGDEFDDTIPPPPPALNRDETQVMSNVTMPQRVSKANVSTKENNNDDGDDDATVESHTSYTSHTSACMSYADESLTDDDSYLQSHVQMTPQAGEKRFVSAQACAMLPTRFPRRQSIADKYLSCIQGNNARIATPSDLAVQEELTFEKSSWGYDMTKQSITNNCDRWTKRPTSRHNRRNSVDNAYYPRSPEGKLSSQNQVVEQQKEESTPKRAPRRGSLDCVLANYMNAVQGPPPCPPTPNSEKVRSPKFSAVKKMFMFEHPSFKSKLSKNGTAQQPQREQSMDDDLSTARQASCRTFAETSMDLNNINNNEPKNRCRSQRRGSIDSLVAKFNNSITSGLKIQPVAVKLPHLLESSHTDNKCIVVIHNKAMRRASTGCNASIPVAAAQKSNTLASSQETANDTKPKVSQHRRASMGATTVDASLALSIKDRRKMFEQRR